MWSAENSYISMLGSDQNPNVNSDAKVEKYFDIFFVAFHTGQCPSSFHRSIIFPILKWRILAHIWGNLVSFLFLRNIQQKSKDDWSKCGAEFLESEHISENDRSYIPQTTVWFDSSITNSKEFWFLDLYLVQHIKRDRLSLDCVRYCISYAEAWTERWKQMTHGLFSAKMWSCLFCCRE